MFEVLGWKKRDWNFVGMRYGAFAFSGVLLAIGFYAIVMMATGKARMGIDFVGGLTMNVAIDKAIPLDDIRKGFMAGGIGEAEIQQIQSVTGQRLLIKLRKSGQDKDVQALLARIAPEAVVTVEGVQEVGPAVGEKLREQAAWAVLWAIILITVYIWFRFEPQFGFGAVIGLLHDVVLTFGLIVLFRLEFSLNMVAAILTVIGYSMNDTVVVFDRLRENLRKYKTMPLREVIDLSLNETLSRTIIPGVTAVMVLAALAIFGGEALFGFSIALMFGIIIGTYSSIYVGAPIILLWGVKRGDEEAEPLPVRA